METPIGGDSEGEVQGSQFGMLLVIHRHHTENSNIRGEEHSREGATVVGDTVEINRRLWWLRWQRCRRWSLSNPW